MNAYDFDYYNGMDIVYPTKPTKPTLGRAGVVNSVEAMAWAEALVDYEHELKSYEDDFAYYRAQKGLRLAALQERLRDDYDLTEAQFFVLWHRAWDQGHSSGLSEVYHYFDEFYDMASEFAALEKG
jgi:hypothetical protein